MINTRKSGAKEWRSSVTRNTLLNVLDNFNEVIVYDFETSGFSPVKDRPIQMSAIKYRINDTTKKFEQIDKFNEYINPGFAVSSKITEITGITNELLSAKPTEDELFPKILEFFGEEVVLAGYNSAKFDDKFMRELYRRNGHSIEITSLDVLEMARDLPCDSPSNKLGDIAHTMGVDTGLTFHNSFDDVTATARLLMIYADTYTSEEDDDDRTLINVEVQYAAYWEKFQMRRVYVTTNMGKCCYDTTKKAWLSKEPGFIEKVNMEKLEADVLKKYKAPDMDSLAKDLRKSWNARQTKAV